MAQVSSHISSLIMSIAQNKGETVTITKGIEWIHHSLHKVHLLHMIKWWHHDQFADTNEWG